VGNALILFHSLIPVTTEGLLTKLKSSVLFCLMSGTTEGLSVMLKALVLDDLIPVTS